MKTPAILWQPTKEGLEQTNLSTYLQWLTEHTGETFTSYDALWAWSVSNIDDFWASIWAYFEVMAHTPYKAVRSTDAMPAVNWFEGATLNYAEHIFRNETALHPAILFKAESKPIEAISWTSLRENVAKMAAYLKAQGVGIGDRVVAYLPNIPEATIGFLATCALGAVWSSCSPDFGVASVIERFEQITPKAFIAVNGYTYNGKTYDRTAEIQAMLAGMPTIDSMIVVEAEDNPHKTDFPVKTTTWHSILVEPHRPNLVFEAVPFAHPIWVLYSSGTTGTPKAITHSQGGVLLEHLKYLSFHNDVHKGERFFWFSTTGWMMWNFVQASLLVGATIVLYDGSPHYPDLNALWKLTEEAEITHFGTSAPYILACRKAGITPKKQFNVSKLRSISSTGAPLPPEGFQWIYEHVKDHVWFCSMSGGTDVCTAFVGGVPTEPVYEGEIQRRSLGAAVYAFDEWGNAVINEVGEMVLSEPMPSMPIYFWNDPHKTKYLDSYFTHYEGKVWRHGDWLTLTDRNTLLIWGRSDATLNRNGVRIGTAEIYRALEQIPDIQDSLIVNLEQKDGTHFMPLFIQVKTGVVLNEALKTEISQLLRSMYSPRHVPDAILLTPEVPYTISGKKMEAPVKKILMGLSVEKAANKGAM
ncbi:MAG TPA: acetoacetate--CoA ligase, partial [Rhodothermales bacterium]|nr:acetoacetate--CoA ligase [Rhodothermales bacterium]